MVVSGEGDTMNAKVLAAISVPIAVAVTAVTVHAVTTHPIVRPSGTTSYAEPASPAVQQGSTVAAPSDSPIAASTPTPEPTPVPTVAPTATPEATPYPATNHETYQCPSGYHIVNSGATNQWSCVVNPSVPTPGPVAR